MYDIFTERYEPNNSIVIPPEFRLVKDLYTRALRTIINYYNNSNARTRSNHLVAKILNDAHIPTHYDTLRYLNIAFSRSPYIGKLHGLTSELSYGEFFEGVFYYGCKETIIYVETYISPSAEITAWRTFRPINVLHHGISDLGLAMPDGRNNNTYRGHVTLTLDIPLLLFMYKGFVLERSEEDRNLSIQHFIGAYVLPNILKSHIDMCIVNRVFNTHNGIPFSETTAKYPFNHLANSSSTDKLDVVIKKILKHIVNNPLAYETVLKNIPSVIAKDADEFLLVPDVTRTRQVWWALYLSRIDVITNLISLGGERGKRKNKQHLSDMIVNIKRLRNDHVFDKVLDTDELYDLNDTFDHLLQN